MMIAGRSHARRSRPWCVIISTVAALGVGTPAFGRPDLGSMNQDSTDKHGAKPVIGWSSVAQNNPEYVLFGEMHGTAESPAIFGALVSSLAIRRKKVLVALELSADADDVLQEAWRLGSNDFREKLLSKGWADRDDGNGSVAMLAMLTTLHELKLQGANVSVVYFGGFKNEAQRLRLIHNGDQEAVEIAQAENILSAAKGKTFDVTLVLTGNIHAQRTKVERPSISFRPMAMHLASKAKIISLNMATSGGQTWGCALRPGQANRAPESLTADMMDCSGHSFEQTVPLKGEPRLQLGKLDGVTDGVDFDGFYWVGRVTASPPAVK